MKTSWLSVAAMVLFSAVPTSSQALNEKDIAKLVDEYGQEKTSDARRSEIELKLLRVKPAATTKAVKAGLGQESRRAKVLALAATLWTPGVFNEAKKLSETEHCEKVCLLGLQRQEKGAVDYLFERWKTAAVDSPEFSTTHAAFCAHYVEAAWLDRFKEVAENPQSAARKEFALEVLNFQLSLNCITLEELQEVWKEAREARERDGKCFELEGRELVVSGWHNDGVTRQGANFVLKPRTDSATHQIYDVKAMPRELQTGNWRIRVRVLLRDVSCELEVSIGAQQNGKTVGPSLKTENAKWIAPVKNNDVGKTAALKANSWHTLQFMIRYDATSKTKFTRVATLSVDGAAVGGERTFNGEWESFDVTVTKGEGVVTPFELICE